MSARGRQKTPEQAAAAKAAGRKTLGAERAATERAIELVAGEQARLKAEAAARRATREVTTE